MSNETRPTGMPDQALLDKLHQFRTNPDQKGMFRELRKELKDAGRRSELAELFEIRGAHEFDAKERSRLYFEAAEIHFDQGENKAGQSDLAKSLDADPLHEKAASLQFDILLREGRYAEAAELVDGEITAITLVLEDRPSAALTRRLADRYRASARLYQDKLGRLDKALAGWQSSFQLEPDNAESLQQSREIYKSLGDEEMVSRLYEMELQLISAAGDSSRRAELELELGTLKKKRSETQSAAEHLESALRLAPENTSAQESLADVLASLENEQERASQLYLDLGKKRIETQDPDGAIRYLKRALTADPSSKEGNESMEGVLRLARRWTELGKLYEQQLARTGDPQERANLLVRHAELCEHELDDRQKHKELLLELVGLYGTQSEYGERLTFLYKEDGDGEKLAGLIETEISQLGNDSTQVIPRLLDLATVYREMVKDRDRAAQTLHRILGLDPLNDEALSRYAEHFRERRDWLGLTDLSEYLIDQLREKGAPADELITRLEGVAELCEVRLGDIDRAIQTWQRIQEIEGHTQRTSQALQRLMSRAKMWESLVGVLEQEAANATSPQARAEACKRIAQVYRERQVNPRRAIALYEEVLSVFPEDDASLSALAALYDREGDESGLAHTIRRQLDLEAHRLDQRSGGGAREWPTSKRVERLTSLRRLGNLYESDLADVEGVVYASSGILELLPGDREALERMERVLDKAGDTERLEQTLEYHVACASAPVERSKLLRRLAGIAEERQDDSLAMERWENVLSAAPNDLEALEHLRELYQRHAHHKKLADVLQRALTLRKEPKQIGEASAKHAADYKTLANVFDEHLLDPAKACAAWLKVLDYAPEDLDAMEALHRIYEESENWREFARIVEQQIPLCAERDASTAAQYSLKLASVYEERLSSPDQAVSTLETMIRTVAPRNLNGHRSLRRLYEARQDYEAAIRIAEREMMLTEESAEKIARGLEIGSLCRDRANDPRRALQSYSRVLALDPNHNEALVAASDLYAQVGQYKEHADFLERRIPLVEDDMDKRELMMRIGQVQATKLSDPISAFAWYTKAHELASDKTTLSELRRIAEEYGLWKELCHVYDCDREALRTPLGTEDPVTFLKLSREIATIAETRLQDPAKAIDALHAALVIAPEDESLLEEAERIAAENSRQTIWEALQKCFEVALPSAKGKARVQMYLRSAKLKEEQIKDYDGALADLLQAFSWAPRQDSIREQLYEFGDRQGHWPKILTVETALAEAAETVEDKVEILRRKADTYENRAKKPVLGFRTLLSAFIFSPGNADLVRDLWRLAEAIGTYSEDDQTPEDEPPAATIRRAPSEKLIIKATTARREATQELSVSDLVDGPAKNTARRDQTEEIDIGDLMDDSVDNGTVDPTMEIRVSDLIHALAPSTPSLPPALPTKDKRKSAAGPPPPPPPRPQIRKMDSQRKPERRGAVARRATTQAIPSSPKRAYSSPWSELATIYQGLPANDLDEKLRWYYLAAEVWEKGANEVGRAFDVLARALRAAPTKIETRDRLFQIAENNDAWDRLADLYEAAADSSGSVEQAAELLMQVAIIRDQQGRPRETESIYRRVLGMRPSDGATRTHLENLYRKEERWIDLAAQLEERTDPRLPSAAPAAERAALLRELADIYQSKLSRPHDAIDSLERLVQLEPENTDILQQIADMHQETGKLRNVIQTLQRICDAADGTEAARKALRQIGALYEGELELPDRAISAYASLLREWPTDEEAFVALERLYRQHGRWSDLERILATKISLASDQAERLALMESRAEILLQRLDNAEEAASMLRHARTIDPESDALCEKLIDALVRSGKHREAATTLEARIDRMRNQESAEGEICALLVKLASIREEALSDPEGAREAIDEALLLMPSHPTALAALARITTAEQDPQAHAEARLREAEAQVDGDSKLAALLDAGNTWRECGDRERAKQVFEKILELWPFHADATWALAALQQEGGEIHEAMRLLGERLEGDLLEEEERAQILTQLAALSREAGSDSAAIARLEDALTTQPGFIPAIMGLAAIYESQENWSEMEAFLSKEIPAGESDSRDPSVQAELLRRHALALDGLDRSDDAYQILIQADRLDRNSLLIKHALGENRYRARRWREAALHLSALAEHEDAANHPAIVASGLHHAALAEIRSFRPEKALPLYEAAHQLKPNFIPVLQALSEYFVEQGDLAQAAEYMEKHAEAIEDSDKRIALFENLGDLFRDELQDSQRACSAYSSALRSAEPLDSSHRLLLLKLLSHQVECGDDLGAGTTCEYLASFTTDSEERCERYSQACKHFSAAGEPERALEAGNRALQSNPMDPWACRAVSELAQQAGDNALVITTLARALGRGEDSGGDPDAADLWLRLATARSVGGDPKAEGDFLRVIELAPEGEEAAQARRALLAMWDGRADKETDALEFRRHLARQTLSADDVSVYARALCNTGFPSGARALLELAAALGEEANAEDVAFLARHPVREFADDEAYDGSVEDEDRKRFLCDSADAPLAEVGERLSECVAILWPNLDESLQKLGLASAERIGASSRVRAAPVYTSIARALQAPATVLYSTNEPDAPDIRVVLASPPAIVFGPRFVKGSEVSDLELRFRLARAAELVRPERILAAGQEPEDFRKFVQSLVEGFGPNASSNSLKSALPVRVRSALETLLKDANLDADAFLRACDRAADRAGLLICGDMDTALRFSPVEERQHLISLPMEPGFLALWAKLGIGAKK